MYLTMGSLKCALLILSAINFIASIWASDVSKAFKNYDIVPDYIPNAPTAKVEVSYGCGCCKRVKLGNEITPTEAKNKPKVTYDADEGTYYTLVMTNRDVPTQKNHTLGEFCYWVVVNIPGISITRGRTIVDYPGIVPPTGSCFHRYVFLVYQQQDKYEFDETVIDKTTRAGRYNFSVNAFANKYGFGDPIAGNFFLGQYDKYVDVLKMSF